MMKLTKNIVLIGFMGVGKGQTARALAARLNSFAIDGDDMIESFANKKIKRIFSEDGEAAFRAIEAKLAQFLQKNIKGAIISAGGGFYKQKNIKKIGLIVYLKSDFDSILYRIKSSPNAEKKLAKRPLLSDLKAARKLFNDRVKEYEKIADFIVEVSGDFEMVAKKIEMFLSGNGVGKSAKKDKK